MSIQIHPNNCKVLLDATAAHMLKKLNQIPKMYHRHSSYEVTGAPTVENNIILPITLLIKNSE